MQDGALKKFSDDPLLEIPCCFSHVCRPKEEIHSKTQILRDGLIGTKGPALAERKVKEEQDGQTQVFRHYELAPNLLFALVF